MSQMSLDMSLEISRDENDPTAFEGVGISESTTDSTETKSTNDEDQGLDEVDKLKLQIHGLQKKVKILEDEVDEFRKGTQRIEFGEISFLNSEDGTLLGGFGWVGQAGSSSQIFSYILC